MSEITIPQQKRPRCLLCDANNIYIFPSLLQERLIIHDIHYDKKEAKA